MPELLLVDITDADTPEEAVEAMLAALDAENKKFHADHDQSTHGNWASGDSADNKAELQKHLVDYKADRELEGSDAKPIASVIDGAKRVGYLDVPGIDSMHRLMGVPIPSLDTDPEEYASARDRLFKAQPLTQVPMAKLTYTQPRINKERAADLAKLPDQLSKPVSVIKSGGNFYLMNGHHRVVAQHVAGMRNVPANVLDLDDRRFHKLGEPYREYREWDESEVNRHPAGTSEGGQFAPKDASSEALRADSHNEQVLASLARDIEKDMKFDKMADSIRENLRQEDIQTKALHVDKDGKYLDYRKARHEDIIAGWLNEATPVENPTLTIFGGLSGAGKSSVKHSGEVDISNSVKVDADEIRAQLPEYKGWNAALTVKETDDIASQIILRALESKKNLVFDGTLKTYKNAAEMIELFKQRGYKVNMVFVETPINVAMRNAIDRYKTKGRFVDPNVIAAQDHKNRETFETLKSNVTDWSIYENPTGKKATLKDRKQA